MPQIGNDQTAEALLDAAVKELGFTEGDLFSAVKSPQITTPEQWLEKGDWLALASSVGAEQLFFVDQNPVAVFARFEEPAQGLRTFYNRIWCMSRPQLLFLAQPGELAIYDLGKPPIGAGEKAEEKGRLISEKIQMAGEVQQRLAAFRREEIESGRLWDAGYISDSPNRADRALIRDLKLIRQALLAKGLKAKYAHSLIGRSIFIRYLEDRKVLVRDYFEQIAGQNQDWRDLLASPPRNLFPETELAGINYLRVLEDKHFTYALYEQMALDFNGDIFPIEDREKENVKPEHLDLLKQLLQGETSNQLQLFFYAYKFDVIPIELISSIYEEFYNEEKGKGKNHGSHYTPASLVEFVTSHTLTAQILHGSPRVVDPACGSGIFLVEAFRRIVRYQTQLQNGTRLSPGQLRKILRDQIAGIDINEEAIRVAAFSLYLAFLHYQEPREINDQRRLPNLKWEERVHRDREQHFDILLNGNAFDPMLRTATPELTNRFGAETADVVLGNPPWGSPKPEDKEGRKALARVLQWCDEAPDRTIGDKELSQAFIHLSLDLLRKGGRAGLLISSGVLFKHRGSSKQFRRIWLSRARLHTVVNFAQVRHIFFRGESRSSEAIAPFLAATYEKSAVTPDNRFAYWSAKRTAFINSAQAVVLSKADMHWLSQQDCLNDERLWKIYWWGGHRDQALIRAVERFPRLINLPEHIEKTRVLPGFGFVEGKIGKKPSKWLKGFKELPIEEFRSYGALDFSKLRDVPSSVERRCKRHAYEGDRLLIRRGVPTGGNITARLARRSFCFRHSILAFRLIGFEPWHRKAILAIFWSSFARYYLFLTTGSWGMWHDELNQTIIGNMPIALPEDPQLRARLVGIVDQLQALSLHSSSDDKSLVDRTRKLESELDEIVFDLYGLNNAEKDLVRDMCDVGMTLLYKGSAISTPCQLLLNEKQFGSETDIARSRTRLAEYLKTFLRSWKNGLDSAAELRWQILSPSDSPLLAILFYPQDTKIETTQRKMPYSWSDVLKKIDDSSVQPFGSRRIYIDSFIRLVTKEEIVVIKRNEARFWTRSAAREDAEATQLKTMNLQELRTQ